MGDFQMKPSRIKRMREIDNLLQETKELRDEFEEHRRQRLRLGKKIRSLANRVQRNLPDMVDTPTGFTLHSSIEDLAQVMYLPNNSNKDDYTSNVVNSFENLFDLLRRLSDVPWLNPDK